MQGQCLGILLDLHDSFTRGKVEEDLGRCRDWVTRPRAVTPEDVEDDHEAPGWAVLVHAAWVAGEA